MARTHGHGNPHWTRDEVILALELYLKCDGLMPSRNDRRVEDLSANLRRLPYHAAASRRESFRNIDSVMFKLQNIRQVATGKGLENVSATDRSVWSEFADRREELHAIARQIRKCIASLEKTSDSIEGGEEETFVEGRLLTMLHYRIERSRKLREQVLRAKRKAGGLACECCGGKSRAIDPSVDDAMFEVHHVTPIALAVERRTTLADVSLLCSNCHRLLHRLIAVSGQWIGVEDARPHLFKKAR